MKPSHPIRCACGKFRAALAHPDLGTRAVCYCRDCQAFAHFLGLPPGMLDAAGGTEVVAVGPRSVTFIAGVEHLACMSLTPQGALRWYAACCKTPIGNTPRDPAQYHVGLIRNCLEGVGIDLAETFGPVKMRVNRRGAKHRVEPVPRHTFVAAAAGYIASVTWARVSGRYRTTPFFKPGLAGPLVEPKVLGGSEYAALMRTVE